MNKSTGIQLLALTFLSGPSSLVVSAQQAAGARNGFEYAIGHDHQNWEDHEKAAVAWGGQLASVHSVKEYDFILSLRDPEHNHKYLLGGRRIRMSNGNKIWEWSDESPWDYTPWAEDEPSNTNGREDRVEILRNGTNPKKHNLFNDIESTSLRPAIYKRRIATSAAPSSLESHKITPDPTMGPTNQLESHKITNNSTANDSSSSSHIRPAGTALIVLVSSGNVLAVIWALLLRRQRRLSNAAWNRKMAKEGRDSFDDDMSELTFDMLSVPSCVVVMGGFEQEVKFESVRYFRGAKKSDAKKSDTVLL